MAKRVYVLRAAVLLVVIWTLQVSLFLGLADVLLTKC